MKFLLLTILASTSLLAQDFRTEDRRVSINSRADERFVDDINTGARTIELLRMERVPGRMGYSFQDARPAIKKLSKSMVRPEHIAKMLKIKVLTNLEDISEITLRDGTIIKVDELIK